MPYTDGHVVRFRAAEGSPTPGDPRLARLELLGTSGLHPSEPLRAFLLRGRICVHAFRRARGLEARHADVRASGFSGHRRQQGSRALVTLPLALPGHSGVRPGVPGPGVSLGGGGAKASGENLRRPGLLDFTVFLLTRDPLLCAPRSSPRPAPLWPLRGASRPPPRRPARAAAPRISAARSRRPS